MKSILTLAFLLSAFCAQADIIVRRDIEYDQVNGESLKLDLYLPSEPSSSSLPVIVYTHGGCFSGGNKKDVATSLKNLVNDGFIIASVDYRLAPKHVYPAGLIDAQQAVRYLRQNAQVYGIDARHIGSHGESAGGTVASLLAVHPLPDREGNLDEFSDPVNAVADWYGRMDMERLQPNTGSDCASTWLGMPKIPENAHYFQAASVTPFISKSSPPFFIIHGTRDPQVEPRHSVLLAQALRDAGVYHELYFSEGDGHGMKAREAWPLTRAFFMRTLKNIVLPSPTALIFEVTTQTELEPFINIEQIMLYGISPIATVPMQKSYWENEQINTKFPVANGAYKVRVMGANYVGVDGVEVNAQEFGIVTRSGFIDLSTIQGEASRIEIVPAL